MTAATGVSLAVKTTVWWHGLLHSNVGIIMEGIIRWFVIASQFWFENTIVVHVSVYVCTL